jgi:hypothetical protein
VEHLDWSDDAISPVRMSAVPLVSWDKHPGKEEAHFHQTPGTGCVEPIPVDIMSDLLDVF